jgi:Glutamate dehydrogenase/leucine dehydrogenase
MKFCQAFMGELARHINHRLDVPAGDIGVGGREIGYLFGAYKKIKNEFTEYYGQRHWLGRKFDPHGSNRLWPDLLCGKHAAKYRQCFERKDLPGLRLWKCFAIRHRKNYSLWRKAITASDSNGIIIDEAGFTQEKLEFLKDLKNNRRGRIKEYADKYKCVYQDTDAKADHNPLWNVKADCAFPCATQNEINGKDAQNLVKNGVKLLAEGANMPTTIEGINILLDNGVMYAPGKASNAGGVATSGLEMTQNFMGSNWTREEVDAKLVGIMKNIHDTSLAAAKEYGKPGNYMVGANIAGFMKVARAMQAQGVI